MRTRTFGKRKRGRNFQPRRTSRIVYEFLVAGACNHPNVPSISFSFELYPQHLNRKM